MCYEWFLQLHSFNSSNNLYIQNDQTGIRSPIVPVLLNFITVNLKRTSTKGYFQPILTFVYNQNKHEEKEKNEEETICKNPLVTLVNLLLSSAHKKHWVMVNTKLLNLFKRITTNCYCKPTRVNNVYGSAKNPKKTKMKRNQKTT